MKTLRIGIVMDPIDTIKPKKDSTLAFMLEAQARGWQVAWMMVGDLYLRNGRAEGFMRQVRLFNDPERWYVNEDETYGSLGELDIILMRKDPPFDMEYIMATYILEQAGREGAIVLNHPRALRDANEKAFTAWFPQCCPPSLFTRSKAAIRTFIDEHGKIVLKPIGKMGGQSVFVIAKGDPNTNVIIEEITQWGKSFVQAQAYVPAIETAGDKRILLINGEPVPYGIARIPGADDHRGNLAAGAQAVGFELTDRDRWICRQLAPELKARGLFFVGIDVIGDYLTEINVTSPTGVREIDHFFNTDISALFFDALLPMVQARTGN